MLNVPNSIKALYQTDGVRKNFRVHFPNGEFSDITNSNVVQESVKFTESLCSQSTFKFGLAEASVLEFETVGVGNMFGMTIEASMEIDTSSLSAADISAIQADEGDGSLVLAADRQRYRLWLLSHTSRHIQGGQVPPEPRSNGTQTSDGILAHGRYQSHTSV